MTNTIPNLYYFFIATITNQILLGFRCNSLEIESKFVYHHQVTHLLTLVK